jgi:hypothetical protein
MATELFSRRRVIHRGFGERSLRARLASVNNSGIAISPQVVIQLITWFEKLCDIYPNVLALGYGMPSKQVFFDFHENYLLPLLDRVSAWAQAEHYADIEQKAKSSSAELKKALQSMPR